MRGFVTIDTQADYDAWMDEQQSYLTGGEEDDFWG
jgi:heme/copper-type cytochrome/quinol oxidase subunit 2